MRWKKSSGNTSRGGGRVISWENDFIFKNLARKDKKQKGMNNDAKFTFPAVPHISSSCSDGPPSDYHYSPPWLNFIHTSPEEWCSEDISIWLRSVGMTKYVPEFDGIDGSALLKLKGNDDELRRLGIRPASHRKYFLKLIDCLDESSFYLDHAFTDPTTDCGDDEDTTTSTYVSFREDSFSYCHAGDSHHCASSHQDGEVSKEESMLARLSPCRIFVVPRSPEKNSDDDVVLESSGVNPWVPPHAAANIAEGGEWSSTDELVGNEEDGMRGRRAVSQKIKNRKLSSVVASLVVGAFGRSKNFIHESSKQHKGKSKKSINSESGSRRGSTSIGVPFFSHTNFL